jgi:hypothetical protein
MSAVSRRVRFRSVAERCVDVDQVIGEATPFTPACGTEPTNEAVSAGTAGQKLRNLNLSQTP